MLSWAVISICEGELDDGAPSSEGDPQDFSIKSRVKERVECHGWNPKKTNRGECCANLRGLSVPGQRLLRAPVEMMAQMAPK